MSFIICIHLGRWTESKTITALELEQLKTVVSEIVTGQDKVESGPPYCPNSIESKQRHQRHVLKVKQPLSHYIELSLL